MTKEQFQELLQRYRAGNCSQEEIGRIEEWFNSISDESRELNPVDRKASRDRILTSIRGNLPGLNRDSRGRPLSFFLKVAAVFAIAAAVAYYLVDFRWSQTSAYDNTIHGRRVQQANRTSSTLKITLPDASTVELRPNAEISYAQTWNDQKREVDLTGEAFFQVVKDSHRPFYVYSGKVVTKVLGTSFTIKASPDAESVEVAVHTGKVSVYEHLSKDSAIPHGVDVAGVVLSPNEKVQFFFDDRHWVTGLVSEPKPLPEANKAVEFVFSDTPLTEIIARIERTYLIDIIAENDLSDSCTFTGDVSMMELYDVLDVICKSTGTSYSVKGTKILVTGRGCE